MRWLIIVLIFLSAANAQSQSKWEPEFKKFDEQDRLNDPPKERAIVFTGSSSIRMWKDVADALNNDKIINRGFGGSEFIDIIENFERVIGRYNPAQVVLYSGDNDITHGKSATEVYGDFCTVYGMIRARFPEARISVLSIKPSPARWAKAGEMEKANQLIKTYAEGKPGLSFIDVYTPMLTEEGKPRQELYVEDGIHMTPAGYEIWKKAIAPMLVTTN
ncbi:GDSL-type esterase/lipase family protein [Fulvivirga ulvae]|uniref:SGNH/GDSL hydrolase family protein n=1 Tax=Fulvivirga ulvae TaxID=2904245 RepID=UPI001F451C71|nr:SGNH/GDSL hydrolase family protein [Fulvivirga ulvae]UII32112.1 GDSL-type esterase/lipase family protein [Fulvivirga ulvae]